MPDRSSFPAARTWSSGIARGEVPVVVLVDGHRVGEAARDESVTIRLGDAHTLLATLPDATFVSRYRESFST